MYILAKGNSMIPTLEDGQLYRVEPLIDKHIFPDDIIVFQMGNIMICHRVVQVINTKRGDIFIKTKGDNCSEPDNFAVPFDKVIGRIICENG